MYIESLAMAHMILIQQALQEERHKSLVASGRLWALQEEQHKIPAASGTLLALREGLHTSSRVPQRSSAAEGEQRMILVWEAHEMTMAALPHRTHQD